MPIEVQTVAGLVKTMIQIWLQDAGVAVASFDLKAGAFAADHTGLTRAGCGLAIGHRPRRRCAGELVAELALDQMPASAIDRGR